MIIDQASSWNHVNYIDWQRGERQQVVGSIVTGNRVIVLTVVWLAATGEETNTAFISPKERMAVPISFAV